MVDLLSLDAIRREAGVVFELIMRAPAVSKGSDLDPLQGQAQRSIRSIYGLVADIDPDVSLKLLEPLRDLRAAVIGAVEAYSPRSARGSPQKTTFTTSSNRTRRWRLG